MRRRLRMVLEFEDIAGGASEMVTEGEILEAMDGAFEMVLSEHEAESIDDLEAAVVRMQYEVNRQVMARQLANLAQKKLDSRRKAGDESSETPHRIELTVNLGAMRSRRSGSKTRQGR
jgi:uncharacterized coiled-coil protein SlyX